jgi:hypothetical protein
MCKSYKDLYLRVLEGKNKTQWSKKEIPTSCQVRSTQSSPAYIILAPC